MTEKKRKHTLLISLLAPLLREWGYDTVKQCLAEIQAEQSKEDSSLAEHKPKQVKDYRRPSAVEIIERLHVSANRRDHLHALAARFDAKTFLPTASDVRHFLEMRGKDPGPIKQRQDSFRKVLDALLSMGDDELMLVQTSGTHAGPTQLGPLSDAIKATSAATRNADPHEEPAAAQEPTEPQVKPADDDSVKS
ncbi:hypothetical protein WT59_20790 [Burkholderia territorii]|uniref:hypothetical protein n=1 Tax=Burkholderia territorii TaxID=1503055 RepID=UPI0007589815|nr:hypothetical protein [Burkholderia territorii]KWH09753.1 hypothetical protein WT59_20790 [Burkholderia territorii]